MKQFYITLLLLSGAGFCFAQFSDNFSSTTLSDAWSGDRSFFRINEQQLQSFGPESGGTIMLFRKMDIKENIEWHFKVKTLFNPSSSNHLRIYLSADRPGTKETSGYYLKVGGESGSTDALSLYKITNGYSYKLTSGPPGTVGADINNINIKVSRDPTGEWKVLADSGNTGYKEQFRITDTSFTTGGYFGFVFKHTSTRRDLLYIDDIKVKTGPLRVLNVRQTAPGNIGLRFSNPLNTGAEKAVSGTNIKTNTRLLAEDLVMLEIPNEAPEQIRVKIKEMKDKKGNLLDTLLYIDHDPKFPVLPDSGDILLSEVLFDPSPGSHDFIELYNNSGNYIDISGCKITNGNGDSYQIKGAAPLPPDSYLAVNSNIQKLKEIYAPPSSALFYESGSLPAFRNDTGTVILSASEERIFDKMTYSSERHYPLIEDPEGVSMERLSFETHADLPENWHSSGALNNYATPGYRNSQFIPSQYYDQMVTISPEVILPDGDGNKDFTSITFDLPSTGYLGTVKVYNEKGAYITRLANNTLLGNRSRIIWDGRRETGEIAGTGYYIILFNLKTPEGEYIDLKKEVVIGRN